MSRRLFLLVNDACDIACTYCYYTTGYETRSGAHVSPDQSVEIAERIRATGFGTVILVGGDPLQSRRKHETYEIIRACKGVGTRVIINTSAVHLNDEDLDRLVALAVDRIDISIDSHDPEIHDAQRGHHAETVFTIKGLVSRGYHSIDTTTVVTERNVDTLGLTLRWLKSLGVKETHIHRAFIPSGDLVRASDLVRRPERIAPMMCALQKEIDTPHAPAYLSLVEAVVRGEPAPRQARCRMGKEYFVCSPSGDLTACFHRPDLRLGNLFTDPVDALVAAMEGNSLTPVQLPDCFGTHCASLFDNPRFWSMDP
ncbi:radical SAM protein [Candidatus Uhrbacteria bacterium]|nr:radical SAM protein [Candidatus Uhrbacteria bacterium]